MADLLRGQPLRTTASLTAGRGRGKSAAVGLSLAAALSAGYANIFVTSPTPENLKTVFEFLFKGLDALGYEEHMDYDVVQSTQPELQKCIVRVNVHRQNQHRQTILYIQPEDAHLLGQAELVAIDEAAAIPLPLVQALTNGPHTVIMSSTINGYEGTGRSLSLKLLADLRKPGSSRTLKEYVLDEPIRYSPDDPVEAWLNKLLCLDAVNAQVKLTSAMPHPDACQLYLVNRDTLFSYHKAAEVFLQRLITLYVSSHYKNSPNDLQLMSDAPGHLLFVLLPPGAESPAPGTLPDILCFVQVCLEGQLSKQSILNSLQRGKRAAGDLIPWTVSQQFQDDDFATLSGARVVRIAVNPECQRMGYGGRAMRLLESYFKGELLSSADPVDYGEDTTGDSSTAADSGLALKPRTNLRPLMTRVDQVRPILLHWLGVSFGLTGDLWKFYKRAGFKPVYLRQTTNDITGEHTVIVLKQLLDEVVGVQCSGKWLADFNADFTKRFLSLLSFQYFQKLPVSVCLSVVEGWCKASDDPSPSCYTPSPFDLKRLESYANNIIDYHMIMDLVPDLCRAYFSNTTQVTMSPVQSAILLAMGLQRRVVEQVQAELGLPVSQVLAMFSKAIRRLVTFYKEGRIAEYTEKDGVVGDAVDMNEQHHKEEELVLPTLNEELENAGDDASRKLKRKQREFINSLDLQEFQIGGDEQEWSKELSRKASAHLDKVTVSISSTAGEGKKGKEKEAGDVAKSLVKKHVVEPMEKKAKSKKLKH
jgi:N-acetyltransferase 10